jgi:hypothetical protein
MLKPQSVDVVFLCDTYHEIEGRVEYFSRVKKALRTGGKLFVVDFVKDKDNPKHSIEKETVIEELRRAGYRLSREFDSLLPRQFFLEFEPTASSGAQVGEIETRKNRAGNLRR